MTHRLISTAATLALVSSLGCGGRASESSSSGAGATGGSIISGSGTSGSTSTLASSPCPDMTIDAGPPSASRVPLNHRAAGCCSVPRAPGPGPEPYPRGVAGTAADGGIACATDSECTAGTNGRCFPFQGTLGPGGCSYDECASDSDCPSGTPCICRSGDSDNDPNVCAPGGNCAVDSDCGSGGFCSPTETGCFSPYRYFCHTPEDTCLDDSDCPGPNSVPIAARGYCAYDPNVAHWACTQLLCFAP